MRKIFHNTSKIHPFICLSKPAESTAILRIYFGRLYFIQSQNVRIIITEAILLDLFCPFFQL